MSRVIRLTVAEKIDNKTGSTEQVQDKPIYRFTGDDIPVQIRQLGDFETVYFKFISDTATRLAIQNEIQTQLTLNNIKTFNTAEHIAYRLNDGEIITPGKFNELLSDNIDLTDRINGIYIPDYGLRIYDYFKDLHEEKKAFEARRICLSIARSLCNLNSNNIIHSDICPNNIAIDSNSKPTILDFGATQLFNTNSGFVTRFVGDNKLIYTDHYTPIECFLHATAPNGTHRRNATFIGQAWTSYERKIKNKPYNHSDFMNFVYDDNLIYPMMYDSYSLAIIANELGLEIPDIFIEKSPMLRGSIWELVCFLESGIIPEKRVVVESSPKKRRRLFGLLRREQ